MMPEQKQMNDEGEGDGWHGHCLPGNVLIGIGNCGIGLNGHWNSIQQLHSKSRDFPGIMHGQRVFIFALQKHFACISMDIFYCHANVLVIEKVSIKIVYNVCMVYMYM